MKNFFINVISTFIYFFVITLASVLLKLGSIDFLNKKINKGIKSYWDFER